MYKCCVYYAIINDNLQQCFMQGIIDYTGTETFAKTS